MFFGNYGITVQGMREREIDMVGRIDILSYIMMTTEPGFLTVLDSVINNKVFINGVRAKI